MNAEGAMDVDDEPKEETVDVDGKPKKRFILFIGIVLCLFDNSHMPVVDYASLSVSCIPLKNNQLL